MQGDTHKAWLTKHCTFPVERAYTTCCGLFVLQLFVLRQSHFVSQCYQAPSAILQLFAQSKAAWSGHGPSSLPGDAALTAEDGVPATAAARGQAPLCPLPPVEPWQKQRARASQSKTTCGAGYLDRDSEVRPHPCFFPWQVHWKLNFCEFTVPSTCSES